MYGTDCIAMILAGGRGERMGELTRFYSKPAVHFGCSSKIIDFTLRNCRHSGIDVVGVLTQYLAAYLSTHIEATYNNTEGRSCTYSLPPKGDGQRYTSTADAVYKNIEFIDQFHPKNVLVLSGDHVYHMDYGKLLAFHENARADATVASTMVPLSEASRFGILSAGFDGRIYDFEEKPLRPKSCNASMGIYAFKWDALKMLLLMDSSKPDSGHDFGKDIIPSMLSSNLELFSYQFDGYWRDVGTLESLWAANMDLIRGPGANGFLYSSFADIDAGGEPFPSHRREGKSIIGRDCQILGNIWNSVVADGVTVCEGAEVIDSVLMPGAYVGERTRIIKTIVGTGAEIMQDAEIGTEIGVGFFVDKAYCRGGISMIAPWAIVPEGLKAQRNSQIYYERLKEWHEYSSPLARLGAI